MGKGLKGLFGILILLIAVAVLVVSYVSKRYNVMVSKDEDVKKSWSQVENQYKRRLDLIPNLVETVKGVASFEKETYTAVTEARSKVGQMTVTPEIVNNPEAFANFQKAQDGLSSALSRLMVVIEKYPELKANENFTRLQDELAGTENRISVERQRYNEVVKDYNAYIRQVPNNLFAGILGFKPAAYFEAPAGSEEAPKVQF